MGVYKKGNRWFADLYVDGKRKRRVIKIDGKDPSKLTRREAEQVEAIYKAEYSTGVNLTPKKKSITFKELVSIYLKWCQENHKAFKRDRAACKHFLTIFKGKRADEINLFLVERYKSERKKQGIEPSTINRELTCIVRIFNLAKEWNILEDNPIQGLKKLRVILKDRIVITPEEFNRFYQCCADHLKPIVLFLYMTGARIGEVRKLKWDDVDLYNGNVTFKATKNFSNRTIPLNQILIKTLRELKQKSVSEYVFTYKGKPYKGEAGWRRAWQRALKESNIPYITNHNLRHTFVSNLAVNNKEDFRTIMELVGHRDQSMLIRYSHSNNDRMIEAVNKLNNQVIIN